MLVSIEGLRLIAERCKTEYHDLHGTDIRVRFYGEARVYDVCETCHAALVSAMTQPWLGR